MQPNRGRGLLLAALAAALAALLLVGFLPPRLPVWIGAGVLLVIAAAALIAHVRRQVER